MPLQRVQAGQAMSCRVCYNENKQKTKTQTKPNNKKNPPQNPQTTESVLRNGLSSSGEPVSTASIAPLIVHAIENKCYARRAPNRSLSSVGRSPRESLIRGEPPQTVTPVYPRFRGAAGPARCRGDKERSPRGRRNRRRFCPAGSEAAANGLQPTARLFLTEI